MPRRPRLFAQRQSRGMAVTSLEGNDVIHSTARLRLIIRAWSWLSNWSERHLVAAYDRLVDAESPEA